MSNQPSKLTPANQEQVVRAERFHRLHETPTPLRLVNAWDRFSARVFSLAGAPATVRAVLLCVAHGYSDGQQIPWTVAQEVVAEIVNAADDLPVTADIESGEDIQLPRWQPPSMTSSLSERWA